MRRTHVGFLAFLALAMLGTTVAGCDRSTSRPADTRYYSGEVLPEDLTGLYGTWDYLGAWGGWNDRPPDFERLVLRPYGVFECLAEGVVVLAGRIEVYESNAELAVKLVPDATYSDENAWPIAVWATVRIPPFFAQLGDDGETFILTSRMIDGDIHHFKRWNG